MRIFISHGTDKTRAEELQYLDQLEKDLSLMPQGHEVLLDRTRIGAGDDWAGLLHDAIAECQGAVLLLSPRALDRPWVQKEATILSYRKAREPAFSFFWVLLPGVTKEDVDARPAFRALKLDAIQAFGPATPAADVAAWVRARAAAVQPPSETPLDRLALVLEAWLVQASIVELERLCERLLGPVAWVAAVDRARQCARNLARAIARGDLSGIGGIANFAKALRDAGLPREARQQVVNLAASTWVDAEVAACLAALTARPEGSEPFAAALNGQRVRWSPRMVAWRAHVPDTSEFVYRLEGGHSDAQEDELVAMIRKKFRLSREDEIDDDEQVDEVLRNHQTPIIYVLPPPMPDGALLQALGERYPRVTFILHTGAKLPAPDELPQGAVLLSPGIDATTEIARHADYMASKEAL